MHITFFSLLLNFLLKIFTILYNKIFADSLKFVCIDLQHTYYSYFSFQPKLLLCKGCLNIKRRNSNQSSYVTYFIISYSFILVQRDYESTDYLPLIHKAFHTKYITLLVQLLYTCVCLPNYSENRSYIKGSFPSQGIGNCCAKWIRDSSSHRTACWK